MLLVMRVSSSLGDGAGLPFSSHPWEVAPESEQVVWNPLSSEIFR